jgi:DNA helicase-2/ATP-dependent DNA helicase PcrA
MSDIPKKIKDGVSIICAQTGIHLTDEQKEVSYRFNDSMSVFANPGTGKTTTAVNGLITAQTLYGIKGKQINAMSFTKLATAELSARYKAACRKCNIVANVQFNTFHSICYKIIRKAYPNFTIRDDRRIENELKDFKQFLKEENVEKYDDMFFVKKVYQAMNSLNGELLFSKNAVENSSKFIRISENISLKQFQMARARWFKRNFVVQSIIRGDIPTMVLFILLINPNLAEEFKKEYELMVVDEFQDMSILYLEILALISNRLIVIGDLKQQIYGFNGASLLILDAYKNIYPDAPVLELNQSFRCKNEIVELANRIISPNEIQGFENFKGIGEGGSIEILKNSDTIFNNIIDELKKKQDKKEYSDVMFASRNNASVVPIIEKLYREGIVFRTTKFSKLMDLPMFREICNMADVALNSTNPDYVAKVNLFIPEFKWMRATENPLLEVMSISKRQSDKDLLTMNYAYNLDSSYTILNKLRRFVTLNKEQKQPFSVSMMPLLEIYEEFVIEGNWWKIDQPKEYYINLVSSIICDKTYEEMVYDENDKFNKNEYYSSMNEGIRCYTFHSAKGLEASKVFLLDVDDMIIPKDSSIEDLLNDGCSLEAAKEIRNERNLLYVAITRCKNDLTIVYNESISKLVSVPEQNGYTFLDKVWKDKAVLLNENKAFKKLMGVKE